MEYADPGDLVAVAGINEITIGETLADPDDPRPLPVITVDEPALSMTIGINTSPLAGRDGTKMTARLSEEPARGGTGRQREHPRQSHRAARRVGRPGTRRAATRGAGRDDAAGGLRAHGRQARGRHSRDRRPALRTGRAVHHRHPRRLPRRGDAVARDPQGPDGEHGQPRPRLGAARVPRAARVV